MGPVKLFLGQFLCKVIVDTLVMYVTVRIGWSRVHNGFHVFREENIHDGSHANICAITNQIHRESTLGRGVSATVWGTSG